MDLTPPKSQLMASTFLLLLTFLFNSSCVTRTKKIVIGKGKEFSGTVCIAKTFKQGLVTEAGSFRGRPGSRTGTKVQIQIDQFDRVRISPTEWSLIRGLRLGKTYTVSIFKYDGSKKLISFKMKIPRNRPHILIEQKASIRTWSYESLTSIAEECAAANY